MPYPRVNPELKGAISVKATISNLISKISSFFSRFQFKQISVMVLAGLLLLTTVACNPSSPSEVGTGSYRDRIAQPTNDKTYQPSDGLNSYNEYDDTQDSKALKAKTRARVDRAKRNVNQVQSPGELADEIKSGAPNPAKDAGRVINQAKDQATRDAKAGFNNLQNNLGKASNSLQDAAQDAQQNVGQTSRDVAKSVKRNAVDAADFAKDKAGDALNTAQRQVGDRV